MNFKYFKTLPRKRDKIMKNTQQKIPAVQYIFFYFSYKNVKKFKLSDKNSSSIIIMSMTTTEVLL